MKKILLFFCITLFSISTYAQGIVGKYKITSIDLRHDGSDFLGITPIIKDMHPSKVHISANKIELYDAQGKLLATSSYKLAEKKIIVVNGMHRVLGELNRLGENAISLKFQNCTYHLSLL